MDTVYRWPDDILDDNDLYISSSEDISDHKGTKCRYGTKCTKVRVGKCRHLHRACKYGHECIDLMNKACRYYHPPVHSYLAQKSSLNHPLLHNRNKNECKQREQASPEPINLLMSAPNSMMTISDSSPTDLKDGMKVQTLNDVKQKLIGLELHNKELENEMNRMRIKNEQNAQQNKSLQDKLDDAYKQIDRMRGCNLDTLTLNELSNLEETLFTSLQRIRNKKNQKQKSYHLRMWLDKINVLLYPY